MMVSWRTSYVRFFFVFYASLTFIFIFSNAAMASEVQTDEVVFGSYEMNGTQIDLMADVYFQNSEDYRPLIIFSYGGDFGSQGRKAKDVVHLCEELAKEGFVCAAIDYRTNFNFLGNPEREMYRTAFRGMTDVKTAINYFYTGALGENVYNISHEAIYVGGISIGALLALESAFIDSERELTTNMLSVLRNELEDNPIHKSHLRGVISLCGGNTSLPSISGTTDLSLCLIHGQKDKFIPIDSGTFSYQGIKTIPLYGSGSIHNKALEQGHRSFLYSFGNASHVPWSSDWSYLDSSLEFIKEFLVKDLALLSHGELYQISTNYQLVYPNPFCNVLYTKGITVGTEIKIIDIYGKVSVFQVASFNSISTHFLSPGIYIVSWGTGDRLRKTTLVKN